MKCIFKRQATSANTPIKLEFDVAGIEYLVKNFTQGDIYVALEETSNKNDCLLIPVECAQVITARADTNYLSTMKGIMTIIPEETDERGVEVQCLKW